MDYGGSVKSRGRDCGGRRTYVVVGEEEVVPRSVRYHWATWRSHALPRDVV